LCSRVTWRERPDDKGPLARASPHQPVPFEVAIRLEDGVGVDGELGDDLLGGRQLVARLQDAYSESLVDLLDELHVGGDARPEVQLELDHTCHSVPPRYRFH
jgi:hypothetical protein